MKIIQLIPGAGNNFYCENCLRDNNLSRELRRRRNDIVIVPLYLPLLADEEKCKADVSTFFGGINVYLQQKSALFRKTPRWLDRIFDSPKFLRWVAGKSGMTSASELGEMTLSMLRGEEGNQVKELERLVEWLASIEPPDIIHISNALLLGMVHRIKEELNVPITCMLQDEDIWVDALPESQRCEVWKIIARRADDVDAFIAVSDYYKGLMCGRLGISPNRIHVVYNGINLEGYEQADLAHDPPVIGYLERQCRDKGLGALVDAFLILKKNGRVPDAKLRIAGGKLAEDEPLIREMQKRLAENGISDDVEFLPNPDRQSKLEFLRSLSVLSVPAEHREAFGIYIIEALASGVPIVQPRHGAFVELLEKTGGGLLCDPDDPSALANAIEELLLDTGRARELGMRGRMAVFQHFSAERMADEVQAIMEKVRQGEK